MPICTLVITPRCMEDHCPEGTMDVEEVAEDAGGEDEDD